MRICANKKRSSNLVSTTAPPSLEINGSGYGPDHGPNGPNHGPNNQPGNVLKIHTLVQTVQMVRFFGKFLKNEFFTPKTGKLGGENFFLRNLLLFGPFGPFGPNVKKTTTYGGPNKHQKYDHLDHLDHKSIWSTIL